MNTFSLPLLYFYNEIRLIRGNKSRLQKSCLYFPLLKLLAMALQRWLLGNKRL